MRLVSGARDIAGAVEAPFALFEFGCAALLDEPADGTWTLTVKDLRAPNTGTLTTWRLTIYGH